MNFLARYRTSQRPQRFLNLHSIFHEYLNDVSFEWPLFYYDSAIRTYSRVKFILRRVTHYKNPKAFLCRTCYPPPPIKFSHLVGVIFCILVLFFLLAGIQKQCQCKVICSGTKYRSYFCKAITHSESDQARRCLPSLTRLNVHTPVRHYTTILSPSYWNFFEILTEFTKS